jgi:MatE
MLDLAPHSTLFVLDQQSGHECMRDRHLQVALQCWFCLSYLLDASAVAASGLVADRLGRDAPEDARRAARRCWVYAAFVSVGCAAVLGFAPGSIAVVFTNSQYAPMAPLLACVHVCMCTRELSEVTLLLATLHRTLHRTQCAASLHIEFSSQKACACAHL